MKVLVAIFFCKLIKGMFKGLSTEMKNTNQPTKLQNYRQLPGGNKKWCHFCSNVFMNIAAVTGHVT